MSLSKRIREAGGKETPLREWKSNDEHRRSTEVSSENPSKPSQGSEVARKCNRCNAVLDRHPCSACGCPEFRIETPTTSKPWMSMPVEPSKHVPLPGQLSFLPALDDESKSYWSKGTKAKGDAKGQLKFAIGE